MEYIPKNKLARNKTLSPIVSKDLKVLLLLLSNYWFASKDHRKKYDHWVRKPVAVTLG